MTRIAGVTIPENKKVRISLTYIYGIGQPVAAKILDKLNIDGEKRVRELEETEVSSLREEVEKNQKVEGDLRREIGFNIKRLKEINAYRGVRHKCGLPVHGQRTKTNARTKRARRVSAGSGKRPVAKK